MSVDAGIYPQSDALTYSQVEEVLARAPLAGLPAMRIVVLRNVMVESMVPYLRFQAYRMGYRAEVALGEYDNVVQEALGANPELFRARADSVLVFAYLETLAPRLAHGFASLSPEEVATEVQAVHQYIGRCLQGVRRQSDAMLLWHAFEKPLHPSLGIVDGQSAQGQAAVIAGLNAHLLEQLKAAGNAYLVDTNVCIGRVGAKAFYDPRYWHIGKAPYSREALKELAKEAFKFIRPRMGKSKKCLVLDCDNTLWGGVLGEESVRGIQLGAAFPGSAYREFQQEILNLYHRGILIALCSKNNEQDVWEAFAGHPQMLLRKEHIAAAQINWLDKAANLRQIAKDLNIGLDSLVFVDDSEFEANLVRSLVPEVEVILLPANRAVEYRAILASCGLFDGLTLSREDRARGAMYAAEEKRRELATDATDLESYFRSLQMVVDLHFADDFALPRVAQQTQKTNQFNLTTRRYSEADIGKLADAGDSDVVCLKLADSFGEMGIVGTCIVKYDGGSAHIDTLLMSCRALGRGVEDVLLMEVLEFLKRKGIRSVTGEYLATAKNQQVESFYPKHGFSALDSREGGASRTFALTLDRLAWRRPDYFREIKSHLG
jgi:FkbH-like protein